MALSKCVVWATKPEGQRKHIENNKKQFSDCDNLTYRMARTPKVVGMKVGEERAKKGVRLFFVAF